MSSSSKKDAVPESVSEERLKVSLERYRLKAIELGASDAKVIPANWVVVDERVRMKCFVPRCPRVGESPNCPPYTPEPDVVRNALGKYSWAVFIRTDVEPLRDYMPKRGGSAEERLRALSFHAENGRIVCELEGLAFKDGYYLALGLGGGSCKDYLCGGQVCQFLDSGRCRFPLRARPSMEAMGIDVFALINKVGWQVFPVAFTEEDPDSIPCAISVGIVFIH